MTNPTDAPAPLTGIRVLDLGRGPAAGLASMVLADFGADVLVVEPPGGDPLRTLPSAPLWLRGKRSCTLDLKQPDGQALALELVRDADVVVFAGRPASAERLGVTAASLRAVNPSLVYCSISAWGETGPYANYPGLEALVAAKAGRMLAFAGQKPRPGPSYTAVQVATHAASQGAVHGIVAALLARAQTGQGAHVRTSLLQGLLPYDLLSLPIVQLVKRAPEVFGNLPVIGGGMPTLNYHPVLAGDGRWLQCGNLLEHLFYSFLDATDLIGELLADERFAQDAEAWSAEATEFARDRMLERLQERSADDWMEIFRAQGNVAIEPYMTTQEALHQLDLVANGDVVEHHHPRLGTVRQVGLIAELTATPGKPGQPAPEAGAHAPNWLARAVKPVAAANTTGKTPAPGQPLAGVTILELGTIIATPLGTSMLADLGARVIKVEPMGGDPFRDMGVGPTVGLMAAKTNAGKQSICVNLKTEAGQALVQRLALGADAVVHNYRPGVPERIGIGYAQLRAQRPDLVWVSANGYGPRAPGVNRPSAHPVPGAAMGGAIHQAGSGAPAADDRSLPALRETARQLMRANEANPDPNTSVLIASATLLALLAQRRFGVGQQVFLNMLTANAYANFDDFLHYAGKPPRAPVDSDILGLGALYRLYAAGSGWVFLAVPGESAWQRLCHALAVPWADDPRFATADARMSNDAALAALLATTLATRAADDWETLLIAADVGCVRADAASVGEFYSRDPHPLANNMAPPVEHAHFGALRRWGALTTSDGGMPSYGAGVMAGADTDLLLTEIGCSQAEIAQLVADNVVARG